MERDGKSEPSVREREREREREGGVQGGFCLVSFSSLAGSYAVTVDEESRVKLSTPHPSLNTEYSGSFVHVEVNI